MKTETPTQTAPNKTIPAVPFKAAPKKPTKVYKDPDKKSPVFCTVKGGTYTIVKLSEDNKWGLLGSDVGWVVLSDFRELI